MTEEMMHSQPAAMLELREVDAGYERKIILKGVELTVSSGKILTLIGPNGAGKSTLLKTAAGQLEPRGGVILIEGKNRASMPAGDVARKQAVMLTDRLSSERMTCYEVVSLGRYPYTGRLGILSEEDHRIVRESMALVRTTDLADLDYHEISDGQRQRLLLARAIAQEPEIMILDEPTSYLDIRHKLEFLNILKDLVRTRQIGVLMSLHELELAHAVSDQVICISADGAVRRVGAPEDVMTDTFISELYDVPEEQICALYGGFLDSLNRR